MNRFPTFARRLIPAALLAAMACSQPSWAQATIPFAGKNVYLNGINIPWDQYGTDFGCNYNAAKFETIFTELQAAGVNSARMWVHIDARCSPTLSGGNTTGLSTTFYANLDDFLSRAKAHNVAVMLVLWSFDMTLKGAAKQDLISDVNKTNSYINNALIPMVQRYANHPALLAWEVINEPEWSVSGECNTTNHNCVSLANMQRFVGLQVSAIKNNTSKYVTVGSAAYKWNADLGAGVAGNWWKDSALTSASGKANAKLDFYQVHYYEWQKAADGSYNFSPWDNRGPSFYNSDGKPVMVGEMAAKEQDRWYTNDTMLAETKRLGYIGHFPWAYTSNKGDAEGVWADIKDELKAFRDANVALVDLNLNGTQPAPSSCIACEGLAPDWADWSWSLDARNMANTAMKKSGNSAVSVDYQAYGALSLRKGTAQSTSGYSKLGFWVYSGSNAGAKLKVWTQSADSSGNSTTKTINTGTASNTWTWVTVNLSELGSPGSIKRLNIQWDANTNPGVIYIDDLQLYN